MICSWRYRQYGVLVRSTRTSSLLSTTNTVNEISIHRVTVYRQWPTVGYFNSRPLVLVLVLASSLLVLYELAGKRLSVRYWPVVQYSYLSTEYG